MTRNLKLNSSEAMTKAERTARNSVINKAKSTDKSGLKPSKSLNSFGRAMFKAIVNNNDSLNNSDQYSVDMLCQTYQTYLKSVDYLNKHGLVDAKGHKSPYYSIMKQSTDTLIKLSNELLISPKNRLTADYDRQKSDREDPVKKALEDGGNE